MEQKLLLIIIRSCVEGVTWRYESVRGGKR